MVIKNSQQVCNIQKQYRKVICVFIYFKDIENIFENKEKISEIFLKIKGNFLKCSEIFLESRKKFSFLKYLKTNLTTEIYNLYTENHKALLEKIKYLNKWEDKPCSLSREDV